LTVVVQFRHAHETRIGQTHRLVGVFAQKIQTSADSSMLKSRFDRATIQQLQKSFNAHSIGLQQK